MIAQSRMLVFRVTINANDLQRQKQVLELPSTVVHVGMTLHPSQPSLQQDSRRLPMSAICRSERIIPLEVLFLLTGWSMYIELP